MTISFEDFKKVSLKIARIKEVKDHPDADRLYVLTVEIGEETRELVAGIKKAYKPEELKDKLVVVVDNLQPAVIRGVESNGMVLATQDGDTLAVLTPEKPVSSGSPVK
jgi:methionyl-tRNA synthetase